ncbi:MAG TPA: DUF6010 family protein [Chitinophagaceae bacterium]
MISSIIGIATGILLIVVLAMMTRIDKPILYGLVLAGIGFLYVGFTWTDLDSLVINSVQAFVFVLFAYYGIKKSINILAIGYLLHGTWDLVYDLLGGPDLLPPHYDLFCLSVDFTIGIYLLIFARVAKSKFQATAV